VKQRLLVYSVVLAAALGWVIWRAQPPSPIDLQIVREGLIRSDGQMLETAQIGAHVAAQVERDPRRPVRVTVDAQAPSTTLIPVLQVLEQHGIVDVEVIANP
jgi:biopolymer transport protein ExbD